MNGVHDADIDRNYNGNVFEIDNKKENKENEIHCHAKSVPIVKVKNKYDEKITITIEDKNNTNKKLKTNPNDIRIKEADNIKRKINNYLFKKGNDIYDVKNKKEVDDGNE